MKYSNLYRLQSGDRIIEPLFQTGVTMHHAIYLIDDMSNERIGKNYRLKNPLLKILLNGKLYN